VTALVDVGRVDRATLVSEQGDKDSRLCERTLPTIKEMQQYNIKFGSYNIYFLSINELCKRFTLKNILPEEFVFMESTPESWLNVDEVSLVKRCRWRCRDDDDDDEDEGHKSEGAGGDITPVAEGRG
jgi:hypothetical protein